MNAARTSLLLLSCALVQPIGAAPPKDLDGPANPQWLLDARKTRDQRIAWFKEARFGMFVHWGVYSGLGGVWQGKPVQGYSEHIMRMARIPLDVYRREVAARFNPVEFDADAWIRLCKQAGMRYFVITSKHHDGFAMWPSDVNEWDIADATPFGRDPLAELRDACDRHGIHFGLYYSHAQDWAHPGGQRNDWDYPGNPTTKRTWFLKHRYANHVLRSEEYLREKSLPQLREIVTRYRPELIWFDTSSWIPMYQNKMVVEELRRIAPQTVVNSRAGEGLGDYQSTTDNPMDFRPFHERYDVWEGIPTTNLSYGYHSMDKSHKPASFFIVLLAKAAEKGGNLLMNVGPMGDGRIAPEDVAILEGIGRWMQVNGESIRGTTHTPLPLQPWGHVSAKRERLYLHVTGWPRAGKIELGGLATPISRAWLLADPRAEALPVERTGDADWTITGPAEAPDPVNTVVVVECAETPAGRKLPVLVTPRVARQRLHVFDGELKDLDSGKGNPAENMAKGWTPDNRDARVSWRVRVREEAGFDVSIVYLALEGRHGGTFKVTVGEQSLTGKVETRRVPSNIKKVRYREQALGSVRLAPGEHEVTITAESITGPELMAPQAVILAPRPSGG